MYDIPNSGMIILFFALTHTTALFSSCKLFASLTCNTITSS